MTEPRYLQNWVDSGRDQYEFHDLLDHLKTLNRPDWEEVVSDVLEAPERAVLLLLPQPGIELDVWFAYVLDEIDACSRMVVASALEEQLRKHIKSPKEAIRTIFWLARLPKSYDVAILLRLVDDSSCSSEVSQAAARALIDNDEVVVSRWRQFVRSRDDRVVTAALAALALHAPREYFQALFEVRPLNVDFAEIEQPMKLAFRTVSTTHLEAAGAALRISLASVPSHVKDWVNRLLDMAEFERLRDVVRRPAVNPIEPSVRIDLPPDLSRLWEIWCRRNLGIPRPGREHMPSFFYVSNARYARLERDLRKFQDNVTQTLRSANIATYRPLNTQDFADIIHPEKTEEFAVFCSFPFFLSRSRQRNWGVLPYARQTLIGIIMHREHPILLEWQRKESNKPVSAQKSSSNVAQILGSKKSPSTQSVRRFTFFEGAKEIGQSLGRLVQHVRTQGGMVYHEHGFIFHEILDECIKGGEDTEGSNALFECRAVVHPKERSKQWFIEYAEDQPVANLKDIYLIDPCEISALGSMSNDYCVALLRHGLEIPVGVGFNANMAALLVLCEVWRDLWNYARTEYWNCEAARSFASLGIEQVAEDINFARIVAT